MFTTAETKMPIVESLMSESARNNKFKIGVSIKTGAETSIIFTYSLY
ncbi:hypothetical protein SDC9_202815 [bioreactor metagenome]|uniref:Uncharacterized protein n=1 Tax=bioreactor metagenome TaxID=1076179 RepID=A0A645IVD4_9ZZZZ